MRGEFKDLLVCLTWALGVTGWVRGVQKLNGFSSYFALIERSCKTLFFARNSRLNIYDVKSMYVHIWLKVRSYYYSKLMHIQLRISVSSPSLYCLWFKTSMRYSSLALRPFPLAILNIFGLAMPTIPTG